jgi:hypothetical protein
VLWAKGQLLKASSGADVLALLCTSERCMEDELARKGFPDNPDAMVRPRLGGWLLGCGFYASLTKPPTPAPLLFGARLSRFLHF